MWQFNEKMETLIAAKLDPNYSLWHSAANRTEMERCLFSWRQLGWAAAGAEPRIFILKAPLCRPASAGTGSLGHSRDPFCLSSAIFKQKCRAENALCALSSWRMCSWALFLPAKKQHRVGSFGSPRYRNAILCCDFTYLPWKCVASLWNIPFTYQHRF